MFFFLRENTHIELRASQGWYFILKLIGQDLPPVPLLSVPNLSCPGAEPWLLVEFPGLPHPQ